MGAVAIHDAVRRLDHWVEGAEWKAYDPFDGLSSPFARLLTLDRPVLKQVWQQAVRRFPVNLRPALGIRPHTSTKAMGFFAQGYLRLYETHGLAQFREKAQFCLGWLEEHRSTAFSGYSWGNHFDYQSRGGSILKGIPTIVWTGLIAHAFLDAYELLGEERYLAVARGACDFILDDLGCMEYPEGVLLRYYPKDDSTVHNSSMIGASLLARVGSLAPERRYLEVAERAVRFTVHHQTVDGAWYYGVGKKWAWIDSFHTGYVLEALNTFIQSTGAKKYEPALARGYRFFVETFFGDDGTPRYYAHKTSPIDIQCASQAIQTLTNLRHLRPDSVNMAIKVANWTIANMQDRTGYFHYRRYPFISNRTPTLHWGQATMLASLALLEWCLSLDRSSMGGQSSARRTRGSSRQACASEPRVGI
jgi:rhamnogalacturonyl hydrolase YesR